ncbi:MAG TPA: esterase-like activity of phytase family protein [Chitinophagaceae bacterium]|nr:esterase-like activity of phytase family protein [Chitinophagaceae bacterium]
MRHLFFFVGIVLMTGCTSTRKTAATAATASIKELRFIDEYIYPGGTEFKNTVIGGLSGIDYDAKRDLYYLISDDPSTKGPTRYYTSRISISEKGIDTVIFMDMTPLLNANGETFTEITKDRIHSSGVEAIRYDAKRDELIWSSEGQRYIRDGKQELEDPAIVIMDRNGHYKDSFALPANMHIQPVEKGPRHNSVFEGITLDRNGDHVFVSVEEPIYEDGPRAGTGDSTAWIRILKFNRKLRQCVAQYAYQVDPVPYPANPPGAFKINGVSDILYLGNDKFLVIERAWSTGRVPSDVRVYLADGRYADDISAINLDITPTKKPMTKKLLLDMSSLGFFIDNIEGVTFGPVLPNGHRTLLFVTDDNFAKTQKTQFLLFEVIE